MGRTLEVECLTLASRKLLPIPKLVPQEMYPASRACSRGQLPAVPCPPALDLKRSTQLCTLSTCGVAKICTAIMKLCAMAGDINVSPRQKDSTTATSDLKQQPAMVLILFVLLAVVVKSHHIRPHSYIHPSRPGGRAGAHFPSVREELACVTPRTGGCATSAAQRVGRHGDSLSGRGRS